MVGGRLSASFLRRLIVATLVALATLAAATPAKADDPPEDIPAVAAYVELVPTAGGSRQSGRRQRGRGVPLPPGAVRRLDQAAGPDGRLLVRVATAPELGAPTRRLPLQDPSLEPGASGTGLATSLESVGRTLAGGSDARLILLVAGMAAITTGGLAATFLRARSSGEAQRTDS
jgi:hypothetical protein